MLSEGVLLFHECAAKLISCLHVIGPEVACSEIMSSDWLKGIGSSSWVSSEFQLLLF